MCYAPRAAGCAQDPGPLREVMDMPTAGVLQRIERVMVDAAKAVAGGVGYAFQVPSRTDVNQLYVPQLDRIVLKDKTSARKFVDVGMCRKTTIICLLYTSPSPRD